MSPIPAEVSMIIPVDDSSVGNGMIDPAVARQRRVQLRQKRSRPDDSQNAVPDICDSLSDSGSSTECKQVRKQARYEPKAGTSLTKSELSVWRREARRVRNRESAAASRQKTRERIDELEGEVSSLQNKYNMALQYLLQRERVDGTALCFVPDAIKQDLQKSRTENITLFPTESPSLTTSSRDTWIEGISNTVSPPLSPVLSSRNCLHEILEESDSEQSFELDIYDRNMIQPTIISRPTAV
jgi:bZIP transcription factor